MVYVGGFGHGILIGLQTFWGRQASRVLLAAFKQQYILWRRTSCKLAPGRIMPGTDVGSALQESLRANSSKDSLQHSWKQPYTVLAQALSEESL